MASKLTNATSNGNPMAGVGQMNKPNMMGAQMQRDGSQMDMNGQRAPSPNSNENAPSPNKRPRVEGTLCSPHSLTITHHSTDSHLF